MRLGLFPRAAAAFTPLMRKYSSRVPARLPPYGCASFIRRAIPLGGASAARFTGSVPLSFSARTFSSTSEDYYATLGVSANATQDEIKSAYKKLALEFHPDRNHEAGAEEKFKTISAAYNVIGNKEKRREYDAQRSMFSSSSSRSTGNAQMNQNYGGYSPHNAYQYREMSKEEADRLFREIFGGMRVEQIFRNFEDELRKGNMRTNRSGVNVGHSFNPSEQTFRPFFSTQASTSQFTDAYGNRMEETVYQDGNGNRYTVRRSSSSDPNASVNQTADDYFRSHKKTSDGRVHFGRSSVKYETPNTDFTQQMMGIRSHGRNPFVGVLLLFAWFVVITTFLYCFVYFMAHHPIFAIAVLFIMLAGRFRRF